MRDDEQKEKRLREFAMQLSERIDAIREEQRPSNVVQLAAIAGGRNREPQLSDTELVAVRKMLADFKEIANRCPTARHLLDR